MVISNMQYKIWEDTRKTFEFITPNKVKLEMSNAKNHYQSAISSTIIELVPELVISNMHNTFEQDKSTWNTFQIIATTR